MKYFLIGLSALMLAQAPSMAWACGCSKGCAEKCTKGAEHKCKCKSECQKNKKCDKETCDAGASAEKPKT